MANDKRPIPRLYSTVPNPQIIDAAEQFHSAYRILVTQPPGSGTLLPELHCAFIALELYLKSLSAEEVEIADTELGGAYIYANPRAMHHALDKLFDLASPTAQQTIDRILAGKSAWNHSNAHDALKAHNELFLSSRYPFEPTRNLDGIEMRRLAQLLDAVKEAVTILGGRSKQ